MELCSFCGLQGNAKNAKLTQKTLKNTYGFKIHSGWVSCGFGFIFRAFCVNFAFLALPRRCHPTNLVMAKM
jgi:hypothetical protein